MAPYLVAQIARVHTSVIASASSESFSTDAKQGAGIALIEPMTDVHDHTGR